jgi:uncharacterized OB-fold protein
MWLPEVPGSLAGDHENDLHLQGSKCETCGRTFFPLRRNCPICLENRPMKTVRLSDRGTLSSFVVASVAPPGYEVPHVQGYIDLDHDGPTIFSLLVDHENGERLKAGGKMILKVVDRGMGDKDCRILAYRFSPAN